MSAPIEITLPLPHRTLSPNARCHWRKKAAHTKAARNAARLMALAAVPEKRRGDFSTYSLAFHFPDARRRDDDNAAASCKAYRDVIAEALGMDDYSLRMSSSPLMLGDKQTPPLIFTLLP